MREDFRLVVVVQGRVRVHIVDRGRAAPQIDGSPDGTATGNALPEMPEVAPERIVRGQRFDDDVQVPAAG